MYKFAARNKLRFPSIRGDLTVEQLFDLPLKSGNGFDLNSVAKAIHAQLKNNSEVSFVEEVSTADTRLATALDIVKDVIKTKQEENLAHINKLKKAEDRRKILDAIAAKKDQALTAASLEDLEKQLAALEA